MAGESQALETEGIPLRYMLSHVELLEKDPMVQVAYLPDAGAN